MVWWPSGYFILVVLVPVVPVWRLLFHGASEILCTPELRLWYHILEVVWIQWWKLHDFTGIVWILGLSLVWMSFCRINIYALQPARFLQSVSHRFLFVDEASSKYCSIFLPSRLLPPRLHLVIVLCVLVSFILRMTTLLFILSWIFLSGIPSPILCAELSSRLLHLLCLWSVDVVLSLRVWWWFMWILGWYLSRRHLVPVK